MTVPSTLSQFTKFEVVALSSNTALVVSIVMILGPCKTTKKEGLEVTLHNSRETMEVLMLISELFLDLNY